MLQYRGRLSRLIVGGVLLLATGTLGLHAQDGARLDAEALRPSDETKFQKMRVGDEPVGVANAALLEKKAKHLVYRLTWAENQDKSVVGENTAAPASRLNDLYRQFESALPNYKQLKDPVKADKQKKFVEEFTKPLVPAIDKVLKQGAPIARVNAAMMLAKLAAYGHEELGDALAAALEDPAQIDAARYWVAVGAKDLFKNADKVKDERELRCLQALIALVHRPPNLPPDAGLGEVTAFVFVRRAFIAALASAHKPALVQSRKVVCQPALHLVAVVSKAGFSVQPQISERVEAAVGLGQLQQKHFENYQPDYAAYHVGHMLMDFFSDYNKERQVESLVKREPWRTHAARLKEALKNMADDKPKNPYVDHLQQRADGVLDQVIKNEAAAVKQFADWLAMNPPKSTSLYKDDPKAVVPLPKAVGQ